MCLSRDSSKSSLNLLVSLFCAGSGSFQMNNDQITNLAQSMYQDIPRSPDYRSQWALDEAEIDILQKRKNW